MHLRESLRSKSSWSLSFWLRAATCGAWGSLERLLLLISFSFDRLLVDRLSRESTNYFDCDSIPVLSNGSVIWIKFYLLLISTFLLVTARLLLEDCD